MERKAGLLNFDSPSRRPALWLALGAAVLLTALIRTVPLTYSHFWDETVFLQNAKVVLDGRTNYEEFHHRPPLLSFLYAAGFAIWDNVYVANLVQGIVTTLTVLFAFLYLRGAFGAAAGLAGGFLFAFTPYFVDASHQLLTDMPALALMLAAMWIFDKAGDRYALLAGVFYALAIQTRYTSLFLLGYFVLESILSPKKMRRLALLLVGAGVAIAPYLIWVRWTYGSFLYPFAQAQRIVTEWTKPVPGRLYWEGLLQIFPYSMLVLLAVGALRTATIWARHRATGKGRGLWTWLAELDDSAKRQAVLLIWGIAFFGYMFSTPHKEVRYLLPLAIPVVAVSAVALVNLLSWCARRSFSVRTLGFLLIIAAVVLEDAPSLQKLTKPWIDRSVWEPVAIGNYLQKVSTPSDTVYAAHNFPVFAFYSARRTISLLPIQGNFDEAWREEMDHPGFLVYYRPAGIGETHSIYPSFKPDQQFLETSRRFHRVREFPSAIVYRYEPER